MVASAKMVKSKYANSSFVFKIQSRSTSGTDSCSSSLEILRKNASVQKEHLDCTVNLKKNSSVIWNA